MGKRRVFSLIFLCICLCGGCTFVYNKYKNSKINSVILLGKPGCGKGTQAKIWKEKYNLYHIDAGQILRNCVKDNCKYREEILKAFSDGTMVRNEITAFAIKEALNKNVYCITCKYKGVIIDGCPRNMQNVKIFEDNDFNVKAVIDLNISDDISKQRVMSRNSGRSDDNEEILQRRLNVFNNDTLKVFEYFKNKNLYYQIDANGSVEEVFRNSSKLLDTIFSK